MSSPRTRPVNQVLDAKPRLGPFPADLVLPWAGISLILFVFSNYILRLDWLWTILLIIWGCGTHWVLVGSKPHRFLSKFVKTPRWGRGYVRYQTIREYGLVAPKHSQTRRKKSSKSRRRSP